MDSFRLTFALSIKGFIMLFAKKEHLKKVKFSGLNANEWEIKLRAQLGFPFLILS